MPLIVGFYPLCFVSCRQIKGKAIDQKEQYILGRRRVERNEGLNLYRKMHFTSRRTPPPFQHPYKSFVLREKRLSYIHHSTISFSSLLTVFLLLSNKEAPLLLLTPTPTPTPTPCTRASKEKSYRRIEMRGQKTPRNFFTSL